MNLTAELGDRLEAALSLTGDRATTIADVYQRHLPYRAIRDELGVMEFAAYEHALLKLLGGEGGRVRIREQSAREEIQKELASSNPILGIYRDYGDAPVELLGDAPPPRPAPAPRAEPPADRAPDPEPDTLPEIPARHPAETRADRAAPATPTPRVGSDREAPVPTRSATPRRNSLPRPPAAESAASPALPAKTRACSRCHRDLPGIDRLRYCPFCGVSQGPWPCANCGSPLEGGWSFCIRCGAAAV